MLCASTQYMLSTVIVRRDMLPTHGGLRAQCGWTFRASSGLRPCGSDFFLAQTKEKLVTGPGLEARGSLGAGHLDAGGRPGQTSSLGGSRDPHHPWSPGLSLAPLPGPRPPAAACRGQPGSGRQGLPSNRTRPDYHTLRRNYSQKFTIQSAFPKLATEGSQDTKPSSVCSPRSRPQPEFQKKWVGAFCRAPSPAGRSPAQGRTLRPCTPRLAPSPQVPSAPLGPFLLP